MSVRLPSQKRFAPVRPGAKLGARPGGPSIPPAKGLTFAQPALPVKAGVASSEPAHIADRVAQSGSGTSHIALQGQDDTVTRNPQAGTNGPGVKPSAVSTAQVLARGNRIRPQPSASSTASFSDNAEAGPSRFPAPPSSPAAQTRNLTQSPETFTSGLPPRIASSSPARSPLNSISSLPPILGPAPPSPKTHARAASRVSASPAPSISSVRQRSVSRQPSLTPSLRTNDGRLSLLAAAENRGTPLKLPMSTKEKRRAQKARRAEEEAQERVEKEKENQEAKAASVDMENDTSGAAASFGNSGMPPMLLSTPIEEDEPDEPPDPASTANVKASRPYNAATSSSSRTLRPSFPTKTAPSTSLRSRSPITDRLPGFPSSGMPPTLLPAPASADTAIQNGLNDAEVDFLRQIAQQAESRSQEDTENRVEPEIDPDLLNAGTEEVANSSDTARRRSKRKAAIMPPMVLEDGTSDSDSSEEARMEPDSDAEADADSDDDGVRPKRVAKGAKSRKSAATAGGRKAKKPRERVNEGKRAARRATMGAVQRDAETRDKRYPRKRKNPTPTQSEEEEERVLERKRTEFLKQERRKRMPLFLDDDEDQEGGPEGGLGEAAELGTGDADVDAEETGVGAEGAEDGLADDAGSQVTESPSAPKKRRVYKKRPRKTRSPFFQRVELAGVDPDEMIGSEIDEDTMLMGDIATRKSGEGRVSARAKELLPILNEEKLKKQQASDQKTEERFRKLQVLRRQARKLRNEVRETKRVAMREMGEDPDDVISNDEDDSEVEYAFKVERLTPESTPERDGTVRGAAAEGAGEGADGEAEGGDQEIEETEYDPNAPPLPDEEDEDEEEGGGGGEEAPDGETEQNGEEQPGEADAVEEVEHDYHLPPGDGDEHDPDQQADEDGSQAAGEEVEEEEVDLDDLYAQLDESRADTRRRNLEREVVEEVQTGRMVNSASWSKQVNNDRWSKEETDFFYQVLGETGENYSLMAIYFPGRTAKQLKNKGNREYRLDAKKVNEAIRARRRIDPAYLAKIVGYQPEGPRKEAAEALLLETADLPARMRREDTERANVEREVANGTDGGGRPGGGQDEEKDDEEAGLEAMGDDDGAGGEEKSDEEGGFAEEDDPGDGDDDKT